MAAFVDAWHGDCDQAVLVNLIEWWRQSMALVAEDEVVAFLEAAVIYASVGLCTAEEHSLRIAVQAQELLPVLIDGDIEILPVVHSRAPQVRLVKGVAERLDEMERGVRADA